MPTRRTHNGWFARACPRSPLRLRRVVQLEPHLDRDLPRRDLTVLDRAARLDVSEPAHVAHGLGRPLDRGRARVVGGTVVRASELEEFVNLVSQVFACSFPACGVGREYTDGARERDMPRE